MKVEMIKESLILTFVLHTDRQTCIHVHPHTPVYKHT